MASQDAAAAGRRPRSQSPRPLASDGVVHGHRTAQHAGCGAADPPVLG
jgi:hypothetical protein